MDKYEVLGFCAAILTTISFLPQVIKIYKSKETKSISFAMYVVLSLGILMWLVYGFHLKSMPMIIANAITLILTIYILFMKMKYK
jgi:MtN3 and saliva related transmembrane protein